MDPAQIVSPVFALLLLTLIVWLYMYAKRIPFINSLNLEPDQLTPAELVRLSPPAVSNPSDNLKNLFEVPVIFYVLAGYLFVTQQVDGLYLALSWIFVGFRVLHSLVHCTINKVMVRFVLYAIASLSVFIILLRAALMHFMPF